MRTAALFIVISLALSAGARARAANPSDFGQAGQSRAPRLPRAASGEGRDRRARAPRVGTIKNYEATGLMTGCANLYFYPAARAADSPPEAFVFLSRAGGEGAWMNLDGRDVRLVLLKSSTWYRAGAATRWRYEYRAGATLIRVVVTSRDDAQDNSLAMTINASRAGSTRIVKAVGHSDC